MKETIFSFYNDSDAHNFVIIFYITERQVTFINKDTNQQITWQILYSKYEELTNKHTYQKPPKNTYPAINKNNICPKWTWQKQPKKCTFAI